MRNQGVQTIETGAYNFFLLPPITEPLKSEKSKILSKNSQQKFKLRSIDAKPTILFKQEQLKQKGRIKTCFYTNYIYPQQGLNYKQLNQKLRNKISLLIGLLITFSQLAAYQGQGIYLTTNKQIKQRSAQFSIRGTQSQIQSRILS